VATVIKGGPIVWNTVQDRIPPGGYKSVYVVGPSLKDAAITVTAHGLPGIVDQRLAVVQTATRTEPNPNAPSVDILIQNTGPNECPYTRVDVGSIRA